VKHGRRLLVPILALERFLESTEQQFPNISERDGEAA
jgi:hypothetical protein